MNIVDILFNAAGGGVLGSLLHCATSWVETKNNIALMKAQTEAASNQAAWQAFAESQKGNDSLQIPANTPAWVSSLYLCVDSVKQLTRPLLTWAAIGIIAFVYYKATPEARGAMASEILFGSFTAIFWWFGARYSKNK